MEMMFHKPSGFETRVDPAVRAAAMGVSTSVEIEVPKLMMTPDKLEEIESLRYASDIVIPVMERYGDIVDEPDTRKVLLERSGMEDASKQRKSNIEYAVHMLSTEKYGGLFAVKMNLVKRADGKDIEQFAPLNKPGSFIIIDPVNFPEYLRLRGAG